MAGYIGTKAALLSTTTASVGGDSTVGGDLTVDTDTLYVDSTNNRVGVGTSSPAQKLSVVGDIDLAEAGSGSYLRQNGQIVVGREDSSNFVRLGSSSVSDYLRLFSGGSEAMRLDSSGRVTMPSQPAFRASFNVSSPTAYTAGNRVLNFTDVRHNIGGHYDGTNKFTAPVAGLYRFSCDRSLNTLGQDQVIRHPSMSFMVNGVATHSVNTAVSVTNAVTTASYTHFVVNMGTELYLNASDYVQVEFNYGNSPSTLYEYAQNYFSGHLIG